MTYVPIGNMIYSTAGFAVNKFTVKSVGLISSYNSSTYFTVKDTPAIFHTKVSLLIMSTTHPLKTVARTSPDCRQK